MSRAQSPEGSPTSRAAAAVTEWMQYVGWDGDFHLIHDVTYDQRPEVIKLREIIKKSTIVPSWITKMESPEWATYKRTQRLRDSARDLSSNISSNGYTLEEDDKNLSYDVQESLAFILHIPHHATALESHLLALGPMESDRRHPLDTLGSLVWDFQSGGRAVYRTERKLAIPCLPRQARRENVGEVQPDACAFIPMLRIPLVLKELVQAGAALSCFPFTGSNPPDHRYLLHWVTVYKRERNALDSKYQVAEGLVSALYQRRAYGFPDHFVFGTAHYRTTIEVLAATWVPSDEPANPGANTQEAKTESAVPPDDQRINPPENSLQGGDTTSDPPKAGEGVTGANISPTQDIRKYNKIVMYSIAMYDMRSTEDMLQLYLLMRHTLTLAQQYKAEIERNKYARVRALLKEAKEFYEWPSPSRPRSDRGTKRQRSGGSKYNASLPSVPERRYKDMSIDPYEDSDYSSDSEELELPHDVGPMQRVAGEVASYTLKNYAHEEDRQACGFGDLHSARLPVDQTA